MGKFEGKVLLELGTSIASVDIVKYAKSEGAYVIVTDYLPTEKSEAKQYADETAMISTLDVDALIELGRKKQIDGVFCGVSEPNLLSVHAIAESLGLPCYFTKEQWEFCLNKGIFKQICKKNGISVPQKYDLDNIARGRKLDNIKYPVIIKPLDGSGAHGISVCHNEDELWHGYIRACEESFSHSAIVEEYIPSMCDMFIHYILINGEYSLACTFDRNLNFSQNKYVGMAVGYTYPSIYTKAYIETVDEKMKKVFSDMELKNGTINVQCLTNGEEFFCYEAGYRLGGEQMYFFTEKLTGINVCKMMVNYALTGCMSEEPDILNKNNPYFDKPCLSYYIPLKSGTISVLEGMDKVKLLPGVINVTQLRRVGDKIFKDDSLSQICLRMHVMADNVEELAKTVDIINQTLIILDEYGNDMMLEKFDLRKTEYFNLNV